MPISLVMLKGAVVYLGPENSTVRLAYADPEIDVPVGSRGVVGVVEDASIAPQAPGFVATHGRCQVRMVPGLNLLVGNTLYLAEAGAFNTTRGMATNVPPDGSYIVPLGVLKDVQNYMFAGPPGQLVLMDLQLQPGPRTPSREMGAFHRASTGNFEELMFIELRDETAYLIVADIVAIGPPSEVFEDDGAFRRAVSVRKIAGVASFDGGQTVIHLGTDAGYEVRFVIFAGSNVKVEGKAVDGVRWAVTCRLTAIHRVTPVIDL